MTEKQTKTYEAIMKKYNITVSPNRKDIIKHSSIINKVHSYLNKHNRLKDYCSYGADGIIKKFSPPHKKVKKTVNF